MIPFNKTFTGIYELKYIADAIVKSKISGDGPYTKLCHEFFENRYKFTKSLLTTSCTDALELSALLLDIKPNDEVIVPSFTFVSTASAFALRGAKLVFADSNSENPNVCVDSISTLINRRTKAIVVVHYAGIACDMDPILDLASKNSIPVIEDAAQAINATYKGSPLGGIGLMGAFSFHETKNIVCGEGGMLVLNNPEYIERAEILREKGTNRSAFFRGDVAKYGWVDLGSSFLPADILSAYLFAQLQQLDLIQARRMHLWNLYYRTLSCELKDMKILLPNIPDYAKHNAHMFYLVCPNLKFRTRLISFLRDHNINPAFHYQSLHKSEYFIEKHDGRQLPNSDRYTDCLLRLPLYFDLSDNECKSVSQKVAAFCNAN